MLRESGATKSHATESMCKVCTSKIWLWQDRFTCFQQQRFEKSRHFEWHQSLKKSLWKNSAVPSLGVDDSWLGGTCLHLYLVRLSLRCKRTSAPTFVRMRIRTAVTQPFAINSPAHAQAEQTETVTMSILPLATLLLFSFLISGASHVR